MSILRLRLHILSRLGKRVAALSLPALSGTGPRCGEPLPDQFLSWQRLLDTRRLMTPAHLLCAVAQLG